MVENGNTTKLRRNLMNDENRFISLSETHLKGGAEGKEKCTAIYRRLKGRRRISEDAAPFRNLSEIPSIFSKKYYGGKEAEKEFIKYDKE